MHGKVSRACIRGKPSLGPFALAVIVWLALPASALAANFKITPHIANHTPTINRKWPIRLTITSRGAATGARPPSAEP